MFGYGGNQNTKATLEAPKPIEDPQILSATLKPTKNIYSKPDLRHLNSAGYKADVNQLSVTQSRGTKRGEKKFDHKTNHRVIDLNPPATNGHTKDKLSHTLPDEPDESAQHYQSQQRPGIYNDEQVKNFNNAIAVHSASMVNDTSKSPLEFALKDQDYIKNKIIKQKVNKQKIKQQQERSEQYQKAITEQYQKEKHRQRNQQQLMSKTTVSRKLSKKNDLATTDSRAKLPYGLRRHLDEMTANNTDDGRSRSKDLKTLRSVDTTGRADRTNRNREQKPKTKIVDKFKNKVPTTSDDVKELIQNEHKRHSSRFRSQKDQDELTNRLLSHREKNESHKQLLRVAQECEDGLKALKAENSSKKSSFKERVQPKPVNSKSFYDNQVELERYKKQRLINEATLRQEQELSTIQNPIINTKSRRIASSRERDGKVHERLHNHSKYRLMTQAQEVIEDLHHSKERSNSCKRKGIQNLLTEEKRDLTFRPKIHKKSQNLSRDRRIEDRLLEDAHKRKLRQNKREQQEIKKIKKSVNQKHCESSNSFAYKLFDKDFQNSLIEIGREASSTMDFPDLCNLMIELQMIDTKLMNTDKSEEERELLREIWRLLGGETTDEQIPVKSVKNFICIILNFDKQFLYFPDLDSIDAKHFDENTVGIISREGVFYIKDKKEISKIHRSFYVFCLNRFNNLANAKTIRYNSVRNRSQPKNKEFVPQINSKSKILDRKRHAVSRDARHNLLLKMGARYNQNKSKKSLERQSQEIQNCTFQPDLQMSKLKAKSRLIETPNAIVSMDSDGFTFEQNISEVRFKRNKEIDRFSKDVNHISPIHNAGGHTTSKKKGEMNLPYRPLPSGSKKHKKSPKSMREKLHEKKSEKNVKPIATEPEPSRNTEVTPRSQANYRSNTEGDEVLFKTNSSYSKPPTSTKNAKKVTEDETKTHVAQDLLSTTKQRINEIEKDLKTTQHKASEIEKFAPVRPKPEKQKRDASGLNLEVPKRNELEADKSR